MTVPDVADCVFRDRAVYLADADALVLADLHLGRDRTSDVEVSLGEGEDIVRRVTALVDAFEPGTVVLAGDVTHSFGRVPAGVEGTLADLRAAATLDGADLVVLSGNHDTQLPSLLDDEPAREHGLADGTVVLHGHELPGQSADRYVVGHDHPTIEIEGRRRPCYLVGPAAGRDATVLMLPAFTRLVRGVPVNGAAGADLDAPIVADLGSFAPLVRDPDADETLQFPRLSAMSEFL